MRKTVHSKLICDYIFIGIVGFLFAAGGSHFVKPIWKKLAQGCMTVLYDLLLMLSLHSRLQTMIAKDWKRLWIFWLPERKPG